MLTKKYKLQFTVEAVQQIQLVSRWYNEQSKGLGNRFKKNLKTVLQQVKRNPFYASVRYDNVRYAIPKQFPYAAHYTIDENSNTIIIHAVFGFKESPEKWQGQ